MWKRFNFFEVQVVKEPAEFLDEFKKLVIECGSSGRGNLVFGDNENCINICASDFKFHSFQAYRQSLKLVHQLKQSNILLAIGYDEEAISPTLKIWNLDKEDKEGHPLLIRAVKIKSSIAPTCLAALEDLSQIAIGLCDGTVVLLRGIDKDKFPKQNILPVSQPGSPTPITGLGFTSQGTKQIPLPGGESLADVALFVVTADIVAVYYTNRPNNRLNVLDEKGTPDLHCATMNDTGDLIVANGQVVVVYSPELRMSTSVFEGRTIRLSWFRDYLIVVSVPPDPAAGSISKKSLIEGGRSRHSSLPSPNSTQKVYELTLYDLKNQFVVYQSLIDAGPILNIVNEWGKVFYLVQEKDGGVLYSMDEKDTQAKIDTIIGRSLYSAAVSLARSKQYDEMAISEIERKYGDDLYKKGDFDAAVIQYCKTIGWLEPSYVIRKFLHADRIHNLTSYLQQLHERGLANSDHTTLLLNCYTKLNDKTQLNKFIEAESSLGVGSGSLPSLEGTPGGSKGPRPKFDVETAITVCRQANFFTHALYLAQRHEQHHWYLKILLEDMKDYKNALHYIATLEFSEAERNLKQYGKDLVACLPKETTELLMSLCNKGSGNKRAKPEEFIHIFVKHPDWLSVFLEFIIRQGDASMLVYNTLLELYLRDDDGINERNDAAPTKTTTVMNGTKLKESNSENEKERKRAKEERLDKALQLLKDPRARFDEDHALVLCKTHDFRAGVALLLERVGQYGEIVRENMRNADHAAVVEACKRYGDQEPDLWVQALGYFATNGVVSGDEIMKVLQHIESKHLLPPLLVVRILSGKTGFSGGVSLSGSKGGGATLAVVKDFIGGRIQQDEQTIAEDQAEIKSYRQETAKIRNELHELRTRATDFQGLKCASCKSPLELPSINFLCMHSFHERCVPENETECTICAADNKRIQEVKRSLEGSAGAHDQFFKQLENASDGDGFGIVAKYFGRGLFASSAYDKSDTEKGGRRSDGMIGRKN